MTRFRLPRYEATGDYAALQRTGHTKLRIVHEMLRFDDDLPPYLRVTYRAQVYKDATRPVDEEFEFALTLDGNVLQESVVRGRFLNGVFTHIVLTARVPEGTRGEAIGVLVKLLPTEEKQ